MDRPMFYILPEGANAATYDGPPVALSGSPSDVQRYAAWRENALTCLRSGDTTVGHVAVSRIWEDGHITDWTKPTDVNAITVSTVFLNYDNNWGDGPPILWETLPFHHGAAMDSYQDRYTSRHAALAGHHVTCATLSRWIMAGMPDNWESEERQDDH